MTVSVVIADDHAAIRVGLALLLGAADGIAATAAVTRAGHAAVLVLTSFDVDDNVFAALRAGASGFLLKTAETEAIIAAVDAVARGDAVLAPEVTRRVIERFATPPTPHSEARPGSPPVDLSVLTDRERTVLDCIGDGLSNADIAATLYIGQSTVKTHVSHILTKLDVRSRVQAAIVAREAR